MVTDWNISRPDVLLIFTIENQITEKNFSKQAIDFLR